MHSFPFLLCVFFPFFPRILLFLHTIVLLICSMLPYYWDNLTSILSHVAHYIPTFSSIVYNFCLILYLFSSASRSLFSLCPKCASTYIDKYHTLIALLPLLRVSFFYLCFCFVFLNTNHRSINLPLAKSILHPFAGYFCMLVCVFVCLFTLFPSLNKGRKRTPLMTKIQE